MGQISLHSHYGSQVYLIFSMQMHTTEEHIFIGLQFFLLAPWSFVRTRDPIPGLLLPITSVQIHRHEVVYSSMFHRASYHYHSSLCQDRPGRQRYNSDKLSAPK